MTNINKKLKLAQGTLEGRMKCDAKQTVPLVEIFNSLGVDLTGGDNL